MRGNHSKALEILAALLLAALALDLAVCQWWPVSPPVLPEGLPAEAVAGFEEAESYLRPLIVGRLFSTVAGIFLVLLLLTSGIAQHIEDRFGATRLRWPARIGFLLGFFALVWIAFFPSSWMHYLRNRDFGITGMVWQSWLRNTLLATPIPLLLFLGRWLILFCLIAIFKRSWWWVGALLLFVVFSAIPEWFSRTYPMDLVEEMTPLPAGEIRQVFEGLAEETGRNLELMMLDESERTRRVNMALTGRIGREYVLVTDTLLDKLTPQEARVMLAHELGHAGTRHIVFPIRKLLGLLSSLLTLGLVYRFQRAHPVPERRILTVLLQIMLAGHLVGMVLGPFRGALSRYEEREADRYALEITNDPESLRSLLLKLAVVNLEPYDAPKWAYYFYGASHPTIRQRMKMADQWADDNEPNRAPEPHPPTPPPG